jgi:metal-responsive CopG/Arc/MetJ family transcriptional regulator
MPSDFARISITLPQEDLDAADRLAAAQDRSRSWIVAEAIRRYAAEVAQEHPPSPDMGASRRIQIARDLARTASERIREAEESVVAVDPVPPQAAGRSASPSIEQPRQFATYDEFVA